MFIYLTFKRFTETGSTKKRYGGGRKKTVRGTANIGKIRKRLRRNPGQSLGKVAKMTGISATSVRRIAKRNLGLKPYKIHKAHELTVTQKKNRLLRSKQLLQRAANGEFKKTVFTDEKIFTVQQVLNKQNDRVWAASKSSCDSKKFQASRRQGPPSVMVWAGITQDGRTPLVFVPDGCKINAETYRNLILEQGLKPWADSHFRNSH